LKLIIPYFFGVIFQFYTEYNLPYFNIIVFLILLLIILNTPVFAKIRTLIIPNGILISFLFFFIGGFSVKSTYYKNNINYFNDNQNVYQIYINEPPTEKDNSIKVFADVISTDKTQSIGKTLIYIEKNNLSKQLSYGDVLLIKSKFKPISSNGNPKAFNYKDYLKKSHIYHQSYINSKNWLLIGNKGNLLYKTTYKTQKYLANLIDASSLKIKNKSIAKALLIGQKDDLDKDTLRSFSSAGAMHVLAVSGLHVGIVMLILMFVLKPIKRLPNGRSFFVVLIVICLWFYAFVTGLSPSVLRSALMFSFVVIGKEIERDTSVFQSILVSAFILMVIDPLVIFKVGFQLSYLAVLGIVYLQPKIYNLIYIKNTVLDYLWKITTVSIAAQLATFPLGLYYFHQFPNFFFISNLIVIPMAGLILSVGIAFFIFNKTLLLNTFLEHVLDSLITIMNYFVEKIEQLPYSIIWGVSITWYETIILYIAISFLVFAFTLKKRILLLYSGFTSILLLSFLLFNHYYYLSLNQLIVYNVKNEIAIDVFYGKDNYFICSKKLFKDQNSMLYNIQHNWFDIRQSEEPYKQVDIKLLNDKVIGFNNKTFSILDSEINNNIKLTDYIIIGDLKNINKEVILAIKEHKSILIITSRLKYKVKNYLLKNYPNELIYDLAKDGAFIISF
jgi:competence protein ComEC